MTIRKQKNIPIESILVKRPNFKIKALRLIKQLGIKTAQELAQYSRADFLTSHLPDKCFNVAERRNEKYFAKDNEGNIIERKVTHVFSVGEKAINYLQECLNSVGLDFKDVERVRTTALRRSGYENVEEKVLTSVRTLSKANPGVYFMPGYIIKSLTNNYNDEDWKKTEELRTAMSSGKTLNTILDNAEGIESIRVFNFGEEPTKAYRAK